MNRGLTVGRSRILKEGFFTNEILCKLPPLTRLLFAGLWCLADRDGRLEDRPDRIRHEILGYDNEADADAMLADLHRTNFIRRYVVGGIGFIQVVAWRKHQHPHLREARSVIPPCEGIDEGENFRNDADESGRKRTKKHSLGSAKAMPRHCQGNAKASPRLPVSVSTSTSKALTSNLSGASNVVAPDGESTAKAMPGHSLGDAKAMPSRGSRLPEDWQLPKAWGDWAMTECGMTRAKVLLTAAVFADYWHGVAGSKAVKVDWFATWRNWIRREAAGHGTAGNGAAKSFAERRAEDRQRTLDGLTGKDRQGSFDVIDMPAREVSHDA